MTNEIEIYKALLGDIKKREGWGKGVIPKLAIDLKNELSEVKGFSERNLQFMIQFFNEYKDIVSIRHQPVSQLKTNSNTKLPVSQLTNASTFPFGELKSPSSIHSLSTSKLPDGDFLKLILIHSCPLPLHTTMKSALTNISTVINQCAVLKLSAPIFCNWKAKATV